MKMKPVAILAAVLTVCSVASATETRADRAAVKALATVPTAELPAQAVMVVASASAETREATAKAVVRRVAKTQPAALKHVVAALTKYQPELGEVILTATTSSTDIAASVAKVSSNPVLASVGTASASTSVDRDAVQVGGGTVTSGPGTISGAPLAAPTAVGPGTPGAFDPIRYSQP
ncbi:MAG: hypothetical protein ACKVYV_15605 [Limisphaerales bacterium]